MHRHTHTDTVASGEGEEALPASQESSIFKESCLYFTFLWHILQLSDHSHGWVTVQQLLSYSLEVCWCHSIYTPCVNQHKCLYSPQIEHTYLFFHITHLERISCSVPALACIFKRQNEIRKKTQVLTNMHTNTVFYDYDQQSQGLWLIQSLVVFIPHSCPASL